MAWTILFLLMGLVSWLVLRQQRRSRAALPVYGVQLFFNFFWPLLFFPVGTVPSGTFLLAALWGLIVWTVTLFRRVRHAADWLLAPYLLWVSFTAYLNAGIWLLN